MSENLNEKKIRREVKKNPVAEAIAFYKNLKGKKTIDENGMINIEKYQNKDFNIGKVVLGSGLIVLGAAGAVVGTAFGVKALRNRSEVEALPSGEEFLEDSGDSNAE